MPATKKINGYPFLKYKPQTLSENEQLHNSKEFSEFLMKRRSVRYFSSKPVAEGIIQNILSAANRAPSGANKQPWKFCAISNVELKTKIRIAAEQEEYESYHGRMPQKWLDDLAPFQTDWKKPFLETAPWLIVVFKESYEKGKNGKKINNYYVTESVGIATGFLIAAIHFAGLVTLTHTPSPMNFLSKLLNSPENEKPFLLLPVGYPAEECWVPDIKKKTTDEVSGFYL